MKGTKTLALVLLYLLLFQASDSIVKMNHNTAHAEKKKIILQQADKLQGGKERSPTGRIEEVRSVSGNVVFVQENLLLSCDKATEFLESGIVQLRGNIFMTDRKLEVYCDKALYFPDTGIAELENNVKGRLLDDNLITKSERARIDNPGNQISIYKDAIAWQGERQLSGDSIAVQLKELNRKKNVETITVIGKAFLAARDTLDPSRQLYNQLSGKTLFIELDEQETVTGVQVDSQARSLYHTYDKDQAPTGINYSSGNRIVMSFAEGQLDRIAVSGNVEGKQYPNKLRGSRKIDLSGFRLRYDEKPVF
jgi:lipopolysaccharide export system protein LptA